MKDRDRIICLVFNPFKIQGQIINGLIALNEIKTYVIRKFKFKMETSSSITRPRIALQNMYSAELLQMAASDIVTNPLFQTVVWRPH